MVATGPFYIELLSQTLAPGPLAVLRSVRLIRIFRIFRLARYSMGMSIMMSSLAASVQPLIILVPLDQEAITRGTSYCYS